MPNRQFSVACPVELPHGGKTIWVNVGRAFEGEDAKYVMKVSLSALPLTIFKGEPIELFLFELQDQGSYRRREPRSYRAPEPPPPDGPGDYGPPPFGDEDVPF